jgi:hypothetical protein
MATFKTHKVVSSLPSELEKDCIYLVRVGEGFDLYAVDKSGLLVYKLNKSALTWSDYCSRWDTEPVLNKHITSPESGDVYTYILGGVSRYRFVPDNYDPAKDTFYLNFSSNTLTNLICKRSDV